MKLLLADPDRDFLKAYQTLLSLEGHTVTVCFEGTETVKTAAAEAFDAVILSAALPRVPCADIISLLQEKGIPSVVLTRRKISAALLLNTPLANAYLPFPFLPEELLSLLQRVSDLAGSGETFPVGDARIDVSGFCIAGTSVRLTAGEIEVLQSLSAGSLTAQSRLSPYMNALNQKFALAGKSVRATYQNREGYRLVTSI